MIEAEEVENRGVQIVHMDRIFRDPRPVIVGLAIGGARADPCTSEPRRIGVGVMSPPLRAVRIGSPTKFRRPNHEGFVEKTSRFQVTKESRDRAIDIPSERGVGGHITVGIPVIVRTDIDEFDETDIALHESASDQALPSEALRGSTF